jgi:hypothetical protein
MCALQRINFALMKNWQNFKLPAGIEHFFVMAIISKTTQMGCLFAIQPMKRKRGGYMGSGVLKTQECAAAHASR